MYSTHQKFATDKTTVGINCKEQYKREWDPVIL